MQFVSELTTISLNKSASRKFADAVQAVAPENGFAASSPGPATCQREVAQKACQLNRSRPYEIELFFEGE